MEYTFYIESKYRVWGRKVNYLKFQIPDNTEFILSDEWIVAVRKKTRTPMQRLIFLKRNNYGNVYRVTVEVSSATNLASGNIVLSRETKPLRTSIIILLSDFQKLHYSIQEKVWLEGVEICSRMIQDTFKYKITIVRLDESRSKTGMIPEREKILTMSDQLHSLLETGDFADIFITDESGNGKIRAHRNILVARSTYFRNIFTHNLNENKENVVVILKNDMRVIEEMLHYLYSGVIRTMKLSVMFKLYKASDEYSLLDLKELLSEELGKCINVENAIDIYMLAYYTLDCNLKRSCLEVIRNNFDDIQNTEIWRLLQNEEESSTVLDRSKIIEEIIQAIN